MSIYYFIGAAIRFAECRGGRIDPTENLNTEEQEHVRGFVIRHLAHSERRRRYLWRCRRRYHGGKTSDEEFEIPETWADVVNKVTSAYDRFEIPLIGYRRSKRLQQGFKN